MRIPVEIDRVLEEVRGGTGKPISRRSVLKLSGATIAGVAAWQFFGMGNGMSAPLIITEQAQGLVIADPTRCVACRRCELACTEFNDGKSSPSLARIKVRRNIQYGPSGLYTGQRTHGDWGAGLVVQDFCKQCAHPVPCADACPSGAIEAKPPLNARIIDQEKCTGCGVCRKVCPWDMISVDSETGKASKCFLCDGKPKCVEACPAEALMYVSWVDLTRKVPPRGAAAAAENSRSCGECHK